MLTCQRPEFMSYELLEPSSQRLCSVSGNMTSLAAEKIYRSFFQKMWKSLAEFAASQHIHHWVVDYVKQKHITQIRINHEDNWAIMSESDAPIKSDGVTGDWECANPKRKNIDGHGNSSANFECVHFINSYPREKCIFLVINAHSRRVNHYHSWSLLFLSWYYYFLTIDYIFIRLSSDFLHRKIIHNRNP